MFKKNFLTIKPFYWFSQSYHEILINIGERIKVHSVLLVCLTLLCYKTLKWADSKNVWRPLGNAEFTQVRNSWSLSGDAGCQMEQLDHGITWI